MTDNLRETASRLCETVRDYYNGGPINEQIVDGLRGVEAALAATADNGAPITCAQCQRASSQHRSGGRCPNTDDCRQCWSEWGCSRHSLAFATADVPPDDSVKCIRCGWVHSPGPCPNVTPPPSDAAPVACIQCGGETYVTDLTRCRGCSNEFYTAEQSRAASRKHLAAHPEDAPGFLQPCSFCGYTAICSAHQHADPTCKTCFGERAREDAPGGPWLAEPEFGTNHWAVWFRGVTTHTIEFRGTKLQCIAVRNVLNRDALNKVDRLKGEGKTDG